MKKITFIVALFIAISVQAQEYLGTWSFESVDRSAIQEEGADEAALEKKIKMVSNMFSSLRMTFEKDGTYTMSFMGQEETKSYTANENILVLDKGEKLEILTPSKARLSSGDMVLLLQKGDLSVEKSYTYLTEESYETKKIDLKDLIGKWKVEEVRVKDGVEGAEMQEMIALMITFNFITDTDMAFGAMGMETVKKYAVDLETNVLTDKDAKSGVEKSTYTIKELNKEHMIVSHNKEGTLLYLVRE
ncbi:hypothetical protein LX97_01891 [Nonlabens dokdonensis]|uniref:Lipocalin-like domain-containing protein n=2 Tax=Nonlabens dokdonensis TaxID=328515 RepID=L7WB82_NONDD|nr:hypothetical protein [Nonlabens dokdonensis]AGC77151.1 hypothetical protein DDD_2024 [Nonlabens dokdonensis DSW-6]PZX41109.1 hypothetical protein LX97_01891 [Nonlabens dokdonensis]